MSSASASESELDALGQFAAAIGLAFQVQDDILDVVGNREQLGKSAGKDSAQDKPTYASLLGLEGARKAAADLLEEAVTALDTLGERAAPLKSLAHYAIEREH